MRVVQKQRLPVRVVLDDVAGALRVEVRRVLPCGTKRRALAAYGVHTRRTCLLPAGPQRSTRTAWTARAARQGSSAARTPVLLAREPLEGHERRVGLPVVPPAMCGSGVVCIWGGGSLLEGGGGGSWGGEEAPPAVYGHSNTSLGGGGSTVVGECNVCPTAYNCSQSRGGGAGGVRQEGLSECAGRCLQVCAMVSVFSRKWSALRWVQGLSLGESGTAVPLLTGLLPHGIPPMSVSACGGRGGDFALTNSTSACKAFLRGHVVRRVEAPTTVKAADNARALSIEKSSNAVQQSAW